jgi:hypothetical protein
MKPTVEPLARWHRKTIFMLLLLAFMLVLPVFMFYATGYRYDFFADKPLITATGAMYISAEAIDSKIYINEKEVTNARIFRRASYIQGLVPEMHRVHVQAPLRHTWVKELPVLAHIVTEAEAFNLPLVPQLRVVSQYQTATGTQVLFATSTVLKLDTASSSNFYNLSTTTATSSYLVNSEFAILNALFEAQASSTLARQKDSAKAEPFSFATTTATTSPAPEIATTTKQRNNMQLGEVGGEVYVTALGAGRQVPHYFCVLPTIASTLIRDEEGQMEEADIEKSEQELASATSTIDDERQCRERILMDRKGELVKDFDFLPNNTNFVLMLLTTGLYVVEVDDRAWQNSQPLYLGSDLQFFVQGSSIFVKDGEVILQVYTDLPTN